MFNEFDRHWRHFYDGCDAISLITWFITYCNNYKGPSRKRDGSSYKTQLSNKICKNYMHGKHSNGDYWKNRCCTWHRYSITSFAQLVTATCCTVWFIKAHDAVHPRLASTLGLCGRGAVLEILQTFDWLYVEKVLLPYTHLNHQL